jgi:hypothetical protein
VALLKCPSRERAERGLLEKWYEFENEQTRAALITWCEENAVEIDKEQ